MNIRDFDGDEDQLVVHYNCQLPQRLPTMIFDTDVSKLLIFCEAHKTPSSSFNNYIYITTIEEVALKSCAEHVKCIRK